MFQRKALQKAVLFILMGSLNIAMAASMGDWEESFDGIDSEDMNRVQRGFGEGAMDVPEEAFAVEAVEVAMPKRQNGVKRPHKDLAMVPLPSDRIKDIKDETATTGENAKKHLPSSVNQEVASPFLHEINQVIPTYLPTDLQHGDRD